MIGIESVATEVAPQFRPLFTDSGVTNTIVLLQSLVRTVGLEPCSLRPKLSKQMEYDLDLVDGRSTGMRDKPGVGFCDGHGIPHTVPRNKLSLCDLLEFSCRIRRIIVFTVRDMIDCFSRPSISVFD